MTDNEIINALRDLAEQANGMIHWEINSDGARGVYETVISTLDLINRQKAEIELKRKKDFHNTELITSLRNAIEILEIRLNKAKSEAIKEFSERLKSEIDKSLDQYWNGDGGGYYLAEDVHFDIDNLVKEMVGDAE